MFYLVSKSLQWLLMPSLWILVLVVMALLMRKHRTGLLTMALALFFLSSNPFLVSEWAKQWGPGITPIEEVEQHRFAVVLGGCTNPDFRPLDRVYSSAAIDRVLHAAMLYRAGKITNIVVTGGVTSKQENPVSEAKTMAKLLIQNGVAPMNIFLENKSLNTRQNALFTKALFDSLGLEEVRPLLITSNFHCKRAAATFAKVGLKAKVFAADFRFKPLYGPADFFLPDPYYYYFSHVLIREHFGYLFYSLAGYI